MMAAAGKAPAFVAERARDMIRRTNGHPVLQVQVARTTRDAGLAAIEAGCVYSDEDVWVVAMRGDFVDEAVRVPPGHSPIVTGHFVNFTVDASTGDILDYGIGDRPPKLEMLANVTDITNQVGG